MAIGQILLVAVSTWVLVFGATWCVRRLGLDPVAGWMSATAMRSAVALAAVALLARSDLEHRIALIFALGAAYFAAVVVDGVRHFRVERASC